MDLKEKTLMNNIKKETIKFMKYCRKMKKLAPKADTKKKKIAVNNIIDLAQEHYDKLYNLLNKSIIIMNESNERLYEEIIANTEPNANVQQIQKLEMFKYMGKFTKLIIEEEDPLNSSEIAWKKLFNALDSYSIIFIDLIYTTNGHIKIINDYLEEDKIKNCPEAVKSAVDTILKCLEIDADYISRDTFWDIVRKFIHYLTNFKDKRNLNNILSGKNLIELYMRIENITNDYSNDLEETEKNTLNSLHSALCDNIVNLLGILIVYNKLSPSRGNLWAKEAIKKCSKSYPSHKTSVLDEWENIEIPSWKKGKRYYIKNINNLDKGN